MKKEEWLSIKLINEVKNKLDTSSAFRDSKGSFLTLLNLLPEGVMNKESLTADSNEIVFSMEKLGSVLPLNDMRDIQKMIGLLNEEKFIVPSYHYSSNGKEISSSIIRFYLYSENSFLFYWRTINEGLNDIQYFAKLVESYREFGSLSHLVNIINRDYIEKKGVYVNELFLKKAKRINVPNNYVVANSSEFLSMNNGQISGKAILKIADIYLTGSPQELLAAESELKKYAASSDSLFPEKVAYYIKNFSEGSVTHKDFILSGIRKHMKSIKNLPLKIIASIEILYASNSLLSKHFERQKTNQKKIEDYSAEITRKIIESKIPVDKEMINNAIDKYQDAFDDHNAHNLLEKRTKEKIASNMLRVGNYYVYKDELFLVYHLRVFGTDLTDKAKTSTFLLKDLDDFFKEKAKEVFIKKNRNSHIFKNYGIFEVSLSAEIKKDAFISCLLFGQEMPVFANILISGVRTNILKKDKKAYALRVISFLENPKGSTINAVVCYPKSRMVKSLKEEFARMSILMRVKFLFRFYRALRMIRSLPKHSMPSALK